MAISERVTRPTLATTPAQATDLLASSPPAVRAAYEQTFLNVRFAMLGLAGTTLLISAVDATTSAAPLASMLAILAAKEGERVILVDADPYTPALGRFFTLSERSGFSNVIRRDGSDLSAALQATHIPGLRVMSAGDEGGIPGGIGRARALGDAMLRLKSEADRLILLGTPILTHIDSMDLCPLVDGVVVTITPGQTHREDAGRARMVLDRVHAPLLGVVLTHAPV